MPSRGRPRLAPSTFGEIQVRRAASGRYLARALFRDVDEKINYVQRVGRTESAAKQALRAAMSERVRTESAGALEPDTAFTAFAEQWFAEISQQDRSPSTLQVYREKLDTRILPVMGNIRIQRFTPGLVDRHLKAIAKDHGNSTAKQVKSVLSGVLAFAVRHDALKANPCREVARISTKPKREPQSLTITQIQAFRAQLAADPTAVARDLPDFVAFMLATGARIGEVLALDWTHIDLGRGAVSITGTVLRLTGQGLVVTPHTKSDAGMRVLELPTWCADLLRDRYERRTGDIVFPSEQGHRRDPSNTRRGLREAFAKAGLEGLSSHVFRKTVATLMDDAGLPTRAASDQLGHANPSMTSDRYMGRKSRSTGAAAVLEVLGPVQIN